MNSTIFRTDQVGTGLTLQLDNLTINKNSTTDTVAFTSVVQVNGTFLLLNGTVTTPSVINVNGPLWNSTGGAYNPGVNIEPADFRR